MISSAFTALLERLRVQIHLSDVVRPHAKLRKQGQGYVGLCPFHKEKTPSFTVNDVKGVYHCFGCGVGGDLFDFVQKIQNIPFIDAVDQLARSVGLTLPPLEKKGGLSETEPQQNLTDTLSQAAQWFTETLQTTRGESARRYLETRKITPATAIAFQLGYAPTQGLPAALGQGKVPLLISAGLMATGDDGHPYERFRDRLIFPIQDRRGDIVGFGGRALGDALPKYLNSPESATFKKSTVLYGLHQALKTKSSRLLVVEGYIDVITLHQAGLKGAVAPLGTSLTSEQIQLLWRYDPQPLLCFDGDKAGRTAAYRAAHRALPLLKAGVSLRFCFLPEGEDPDSLVAKKGVDYLVGFLKTPLSLVDVLWRSLQEEHSPTTPDSFAIFEKSLTQCWENIADSVVRRHYRRDFEQRLFGLMGTKRKFTAKSMASVSLLQGHVLQKAAAEKILLATLINHPTLLTEVFEPLMGVRFQDPFCERVRQALLTHGGEECAERLLPYQKGLTAQENKRVEQMILTDRLYVHAPFANPGMDTASAQEGWWQVWHRLFDEGRLSQQVQDLVASVAEEADDVNLWNQLKYLKSLQKPSDVS